MSDAIEWIVLKHNCLEDEQFISLFHWFGAVVRRKTIYEYHRVNFNRQEIMNWTVIVLHALPTCVDQRDCASCLTMSTNFEVSYLCSPLIAIQCDEYTLLSAVYFILVTV